MTKIVSFFAILLATLVATGLRAEQRDQSALESTSKLRSAGPDGLNRILNAYDSLEQRAAQLDEELVKLHQHDKEDDKQRIAAIDFELNSIRDQMKNLRAQIDEVGGQRGCIVSRLYWYTDLEAAKAAAAESGRPILSLRMLGKLTDEFSCANSRFFRTTLYSNQELSEWLRTNFVLHWQSVRPVPRVTIDFGDGRKLQRTITGNSAHYVLASDGTPIDVLPGLYSPVVFHQQLWDALNFNRRYAAAAASERRTLLREYHQAKAFEALQQWDFDIQRLGAQRADLVSNRINSAIEFARLSGAQAPAEVPAPTAAIAGRQAKGKLAVEAPMIRFAKLGGAWIERGMDDDVWQAIANLHRENVKLDAASVAVVRQEFPAAVAMKASVSKARQEDPVLRLVRKFEDSIALDTVRNEYLLHRKVHEKFAAGDSRTANYDSLNEWVYAELFLTPSSDPWLGLAPNDVYTALENDGRTEVKVGENSGG
jgi:hypothetical protein